MRGIATRSTALVLGRRNFTHAQTFLPARAIRISNRVADGTKVHPVGQLGIESRDKHPVGRSAVLRPDLRSENRLRDTLMARLTAGAAQRSLESLPLTFGTPPDIVGNCDAADSRL
jgi:hypothetical protein